MFDLSTLCGRLGGAGFQVAAKQANQNLAKQGAPPKCEKETDSSAAKGAVASTGDVPAKCADGGEGVVFSVEADVGICTKAGLAKVAHCAESVVETSDQAEAGPYGGTSSSSTAVPSSTSVEPPPDPSSVVVTPGSLGEQVPRTYFPIHIDGLYCGFIVLDRHNKQFDAHCA